MTKKGERCKNPPIHGLEYCRLHVPAGAGAGASTASMPSKPRKKIISRKQSTPPKKGTPSVVEALHAFLAKEYKHRKVAPVSRFVQRASSRAPASWEEAIRSNPTAALIVAAKTNNVAMAKAALAHGAQIHAPNDEPDDSEFEKNTHEPIREAVKRGHIEVARVLIAAGADVNSWDLLRDAVENGNVPMVRLLLDAGARVNVDMVEDSFYLSNKSRSDDYEIIRMLLDAGAPANFDGGLAFQEALNKSQMKELDLFMSRGDDFLNQLIEMAQEGKLEVYDRHIPLFHKAVETGNTQLVRFFMGADVIDVENLQRALSVAVRAGNIDVVRALLADGDIAEVIEEYNLFLGYAVSKGHTEVARLLLESGALLEELNPDAIAMAEGKGYTGMIDFLRQRYAEAGEQWPLD